MDEGKIKVNNVEYDVSTLSEEAKALVNSIRFTESEINRGEALLAVLKTAHGRYCDDLAKMLNAPKEEGFFTN